MVRVVKAGDIIPYVEDTKEGWNPYNPESVDQNLPTNCPHCNSAVVVDGAVIKCESDSCYGKEAARINKFLKATKVKGLAVSSLREYTKLGVTLADFFMNPSVIEAKISKDPKISKAIWAKIKDQLIETTKESA